MGLEYVGIRVTDLERSLRFYTRGLGLKEASRGTMSHGGVFVSLVDPTSKQHLELNWYPPGSPYDTPFQAGEGLDHVGFSTRDVPRLIRRLVRWGGRVAVKPWREPGRRGDYRIGFVEDPDGNWVEVTGTIPHRRRAR